ncbi:MAG: tRNA (adenosine(37)-N6)-threonylcarbamoyltransferase complex transferase subunit TsaD [Bacteroidetes bacterium GWA2_30_7]|nr:MAG: tRNA (adenosine(37)-N6)-threonylcarbamoyltransferase complex transferase subunit TsaD [Bacteroidetes bacterium GWA2_30_7]
MPITILGIESSCDDTSAAVISDGELLSNVIANQDVHIKYGGVVPELASRAHQQNIIPVVESAIKNAGISKNELSAIAFTRGPGLLGSLLVGSSFAKGLSLALEIPLIEINHLQAHILVHFIKQIDKKPPAFPFLCLLISGGHTQIIIVKDYFEMEVIGSTIDDAAGEAFDKCAKILGLPYPGGPYIDKLAKTGNSKKFSFTKPSVADYNFSFSGLKTNFLYFVNAQVKLEPNFIEQNLNDLCASIQHIIIEILIEQLKKVAKNTGIKEIALAGGVSANSMLKETLISVSEKNKWQCYIPELKFTTDNAAMIAITGYYKYLKNKFTDQKISATARYNL